MALAFLPIGNVGAEEADTLKIVDVEEVLVIAAPKENRKLRELPNAVTLLSQQEMQGAQVNSIKNWKSGQMSLQGSCSYPVLRLSPIMTR